MAYIEISPKSSRAQALLESSCDTAMEILYGATKEVLNVPDNDIIVELRECGTIAFNARAVNAGAVPDVVVKISTNDSEFQPRFQALCDLIISRWDAQFGNDLKIELWIDLFDTWGSNIELG